MADFDDRDPLIPHDDDKNRDDDDDRGSTGFENPFTTPSERFPDDDGDEIQMTSTSRTRGAEGGKAETSFIEGDIPSLTILENKQDEAWSRIKSKYRDTKTDKFTATLDDYDQVVVKL